MSEKIFDLEFYKKLQTLSIYTSMLMNNGTSGIRKSKSKGSSVEFSDFREYNTGDDFKRIDWNAYGRFDKLFVKLFMEEREALINVFIDLSRSMDFGKPEKSRQALMVSAVIGYLAMKNMDRVCFKGFSGDELSVSPMFAGKNNFDRCINYLEGLHFSGKSGFGKIAGDSVLRSRGISIIISDFLFDGQIEEIIKYMRYKNQEVILLHILSPEEENPELDGRLKLIDSESGDEKDIVITLAVLNTYKKEMQRFKDAMKEISQKFGAHYLQFSSAASLESIVFEQFAQTGILRG